MKIGNTHELPGAAAPAANAARQSAKPTAAADAPAAAVAAAGVPVTLSRSAQALEPAGRTQGEFDAERVKAMRAAIDGGTFKVNAGAIADKLLANAQEVLGRNRD